MYDPLTRLKTMGFMPDLEYNVCSLEETVRSYEGLVMVPDTVGGDLVGYDYILVPGGNGIQDLVQDRQFLSWLAVPPGRTVLAAVCGGALLLGAAGLLRDRRATTHPQFRQVLARFAREVTADRVVDDGTVITAGGVTAAVDLGLYLCERIAGPDVRVRIQAQMDYPGYPSSKG
jgi:cyclohexyl-isocyanide hydratase